MGAALSIAVDAAVAAGTFGLTNVDDLVLLVALFGDRSVRDRAVVVGQSIGLSALTALSVALAAIALALPEVLVRGLGIVPIGLGLRLWWRRRRRPRTADDDGPVAASGLGVIGVAALTVANGADNVAVYTPVFTTVSAGGAAVTVAVFALGTAVWLGAARALVRAPRIGDRIAGWGERLLPGVLVVLGLFVLAA